MGKVAKFNVDCPLVSLKISTDLFNEKDSGFLIRYEQRGSESAPDSNSFLAHNHQYGGRAYGSSDGAPEYVSSSELLPYNAVNVLSNLVINSRLPFVGENVVA